MIIYPAIDLRGGRCVRLIQGDFSKETVFSEGPVEVAKRWEDQGASWIHVVDLDGAKSGSPQNFEVIKLIRKNVKLKIQVGGGIRNLDALKKYFDTGIDRLILGSAVIESQDMVKQAVDFFGKEKIAVGVDVKNDMVAVKGWTATSEVTLEQVLKKLRELGIKRVIYTDISKDGMMSGPDNEGIEKILDFGGFSVIASGGISSVEDLEQLSRYESQGLEGAIIGKALYSGALRLGELIQKF
ncbi:MAG: 1-(5-phosphoribosyl)-5-[(5-phosphoribosylamino)methylideneamino]imidazole-4-carboxamide isomerase [Tepidanaerobacteraceae bacterium]|jgi:phosphoribosylformimino-5-aminoimidazole carboxamide ribotide isomerase|nr:1-(5-phosphoribosyl)-5-[(5-phosphoribosylamino)methylideneamino]imidazole-4-carboxamide isomerase [Tepidanaerobacteraceae bacterium]